MNSPNKPTPTKAPKLLDQVAAKMQMLHYSKRTEQAYVDWIKRFILFHNKRHPREMAAAERQSSQGTAFGTDVVFLSGFS